MDLYKSFSFAHRFIHFLVLFSGFSGAFVLLLVCQRLTDVNFPFFIFCMLLFSLYFIYVIFDL